jgi:cytochrome c553
MAHLRWPGAKTAIVWTAALAFLGAAGAFTIAWLGVYNVAASQGHMAITRWFLEMGMRNSVSTHSMTVGEPPLLDDADRIKLGASAYHGNCAICHGSPFQPPNPIVRHMLPAPPALNENIREWSQRELFWLVKHGLKYTAMPGWTALERDDEIWSVVAFVLKLPDMDRSQYRSLALGYADDPEVNPSRIVEAGTGSNAIAACARCHGDENNAPQSNLVPKLAGLPEPYLARSLEQYASGARPSGIMEPVAAELTQEEIAGIAAYYAGLGPQMHQSGGGTASAQIDRGLTIATKGVPEEGVPACVSCHAGTGLPTYPTLIGQYPRYIAQQLHLWKRGGRTETSEGRIMAPIARKLTPQQIDDVAAYFGSMGLRTTSQTN